MNLLDTIAAVSTPAGKGGVAMIRISGADALEVGQRMFCPFRGEALSESVAARMRYGEIIDISTSSSIDDGMAVVFRAPASFTGEDTVEIYCHGGVLVTQKVLSAAFVAGARPAEAGEFTRRAFINGKMSLSAAESLGNLLEAKSDGQLRVARNGMRGHLGDRTRQIYESLRDVMTSIYAAIDFPEEDLAEMSREQISAAVKDALASVEGLAATYGTGRAVSEGIPTVICGKANAGKSSVYNRILGYDAAIVTDIEGTTRDVLREQATLGSVTLLLSDTAGLRETEDKVESIGIERAKTEIEGAELVLAVFDASAPLSESDLNIYSELIAKGVSCIALLNKSDLVADAQTEAAVRGVFEHAIDISAKDGKGFAVLAALVDKLFIDGDIDMDNDAIVTGTRQYSSLKLAADALHSSLDELLTGTPFDLCCIGIETAMSCIGEVDGRAIGEEIVAEIFSKFCVGK